MASASPVPWPPVLERRMALAASCRRRAVSCMAGEDFSRASRSSRRASSSVCSRQLALGAAAATPPMLGGPPDWRRIALRLLLLALGQLAQPLERGVDLVVRLLLLAALHGLVLVLQLVQLQLEQVGQLLRVHALAAAALAFAAEADLDVAEGGLRALQVLERALLGRQRLLGLLRLELPAGGRHLDLAAARSDCAVLAKPEPGSSTPRFAMRWISDCTWSWSRPCTRARVRRGLRPYCLSALRARSRTSLKVAAMIWRCW